MEKHCLYLNLLSSSQCPFIPNFYSWPPFFSPFALIQILPASQEANTYFHPNHTAKLMHKNQMHRHEHQLTDTQNTHTYKTTAILLRGQPPTMPTSCNFARDSSEHSSTAFVSHFSTGKVDPGKQLLSRLLYITYLFGMCVCTLECSCMSFCVHVWLSDE